jgi:hypothetical protein
VCVCVWCELECELRFGVLDESMFSSINVGCDRVVGRSMTMAAGLGEAEGGRAVLNKRQHI